MSLAILALALCALCVWQGLMLNKLEARLNDLSDTVRYNSHDLNTLFNWKEHMPTRVDIRELVRREIQETEVGDVPDA